MKEKVIVVVLITVILSLIVVTYSWIRTLSLEQINVLAKGLMLVFGVMWLYVFSKSYIEMKKTEEKIKLQNITSMFHSLDERITFLENEKR